MTTNNVQQTAGMSEPTDLSAVNNLNGIVSTGYGGSHGVFDSNHYKAQMRLPGELIEFNASQGAIVGHGYTWVINLLSYDDANTSERLQLPPTDLTIKHFMDTQMVIFLEKYKPTLLYFPATNHDILAVNFDGTY